MVFESVGEREIARNSNKPEEVVETLRQVDALVAQAQSRNSPVRLGVRSMVYQDHPGEAAIGTREEE